LSAQYYKTARNGRERVVRLERHRRRVARHHQTVARPVHLGRGPDRHQPPEAVLRRGLRHVHVPDHGQPVRGAGQRPAGIRVSRLRDHRADDAHRRTVAGRPGRRPPRVRVAGQQMVHVLDAVCRRVDCAADFRRPPPVGAVLLPDQDRVFRMVRRTDRGQRCRLRVRRRRTPLF